jgi:hypothetical protein
MGAGAGIMHGIIGGIGGQTAPGIGGMTPGGSAGMAGGPIGAAKPQGAIPQPGIGPP